MKLYKFSQSPKFSHYYPKFNEYRDGVLQGIWEVELLKEHPYCYHIRLETGETCFVPKVDWMTEEERDDYEKVEHEMYVEDRKRMKRSREKENWWQKVLYDDDYLSFWKELSLYAFIFFFIIFIIMILVP